MSSPLSLSLDGLDTPCLVLDRIRLTRNLDRFAQAVKARGVRFRPHLKTAKSAEVARLAAPAPDTPVAVSTLLEAEYFFSNGYRDIYYAVGIGPGKFGRAARLLRAGASLLISVDDPETAARLAAFAAAEKVQFNALVEVDCGDRRSGVPLDSPLLLPIARALGPNFAGVTSHGGKSYDARSPEEVDGVARDEAEAVRRASKILAQGGIRGRFACVGSSPTALAHIDLQGVTDVLAGVYMFGDLFQAGIGTCSIDDLAATVLTEVISRPRDRPGEFLVDAGALALSKDLSTAVLSPEHQAGYGLLCDLDGRLLPGFRLQRLWQEHGLVAAGRPLAADLFPVGTRLRVLPNHACLTAAAYSQYHVVDGSRAVTAVWPRINGW